MFIGVYARLRVLWVSMGAYGRLWLLGVYGYLWLSGCVWVCMGAYEFHGCLWVSWVSMGIIFKY